MSFYHAPEASPNMPSNAEAEGPSTGCGILGRYPILSVVAFVSLLSSEGFWATQPLSTWSLTNNSARFLPLLGLHGRRSRCWIVALGTGRRKYQERYPAVGRTGGRHVHSRLEGHCLAPGLCQCSHLRGGHDEPWTCILCGLEDTWSLHPHYCYCLGDWIDCCTYL